MIVCIDLNVLRMVLQFLDKMRSKGQGRYKTKCGEKDGDIHDGSLLSSIYTVSQKTNHGLTLPFLMDL